MNVIAPLSWPCEHLAYRPLPSAQPCVMAPTPVWKHLDSQCLSLHQPLFSVCLKALSFSVTIPKYLHTQISDSLGLWFLLRCQLEILVGKEFFKAGISWKQVLSDE